MTSVQQDLLEYALTHTRRHDPTSSFLAARSVNVARSEQLVLDALAVLGPSTDEQILKWVRGQGHTVTEARLRSARADLANAEKRVPLVVLHEACGGTTSSGRKANTWRLKEAV